MKKLGPFLAIAILVLSVAGRQAKMADKGPNSNGDAGEPKAPSGKVVIPPEKARPITIPKAAAPPVIDGRLDDEVWKSAAVFKDFYQTGPGYNTEPSKPTEVYMFPNVDFYSASTYYLMGIPLDLFTPIFAVSRISGWTGHILEQYANNKLIRPRAEYIGARDLKYTPLADR